MPGPHTSTPIRWLAAAATLALTVVVLPPRPAFAAVPAGGMSATQLDAAFRSYGDTSGRWNGGDSTASVPLPDGRVAWLFSDTFLGPIGADGSRPRSAPFVHNSMVLQEGAALTETRTGGTPTAPTSLVGGDRDGDTTNAGYWVADGTATDSGLQVLYNHYRKTGSGGLDVALTGTSLATFALPSLQLQSLTDLGLGADVAWGSALLNDGGHTYVYGSERTSDGMTFARVARVPQGRLDSAWQYWTGTSWSPDRSASARLLSGVGTAFGVQRTGDRYVLATMDSTIAFNPTVVSYTAPSPTGPFTGPAIVHTAPEPAAGRSAIVYDVRLHPALDRPGKLLLSYNVNSLDPDVNYADARLYRPRFVEVDWPLPVPDPASVPPAPGAPAAAVDPEGQVRLSWQPVAGAARYRIHQRDVTAGQTHPVRLPTPFEGTAAQLGGLVTGHAYELSVSAENSVGEGPRSASVSATPRIPAPAAPTGVAASADERGRLRVTWSPVAGAWRYQVFRRDLTAGQSTFEGMSKVDGSETSQQLDWLTPGHEYELHVVAENGGGPSAPSASVRATTRYDVPAVPAGVTATANPDGTLSLRWSAAGAGAWYWVYQRDVTAGETDFTRLGLPAEGTTLTAGALRHQHVYEFAVAAFNGGGESARSAVVTATARFPVPAAPTNLRAEATDGAVKLTWDATSDDHWYWVWQRDVTAGEATFVKLELPVSQGTTATPGHLVNAHEYEFAVSAIGPGNTEGPRSTPARATPNLPLPGAPTDVAATPNADGTVALSWKSTGQQVWHWIHQRDVTANGAWQRLEYPVTSGTTFTAGLLTHNHRYEFAVTAFNSAGDSPRSATAAADVRYARPGAPTGLRVATDGDGGVDLNWVAPAPGLFYWVYRRDVTAGEQFVKSVYPTDKPAASLGLLRHGHRYEFRVTAENAGGEGPASATVSATVTGGLPAAPSKLSVSVGDASVKLTWTASPTPNVSYWIEHRVSGGTWQRAQFPVSTCCTHMVQYLSNGTTYDFRVRAGNASGDSSASNVVSAAPMPPSPAAPSGLTAKAGDGSVTVTWKASATPNVYYWIEYRTGGGGWQRSKYPDSTCCDSTVTYLTNGSTYEFRVRATNAAGDSNPSNTVSAKPMPPFPQPPSGLTVTPALGKATLKWNASPTKNVYYWIEYRPPGGQWLSSKFPDSTCCTFTLDYLNASSYEFRVRATNAAGNSDPSNTVTVSMPLPAAPTGVTASQAGPYQAKVTWQPVAGADAYILYHGVSGSIWDVPTLKPLAYPIMGGSTSSFTADHLLQPGVHFWAVAATKYGRTGPKVGYDTMSPLMENEYYSHARYFMFDGPKPSMGAKAVTGTRTATVDGGIVVARAFIAPGDNLIYKPIGDGMRSYSQSPTESARIHVAWDTGRGQLGVVAQASCAMGLCHTAMPISFAYSDANDTVEVDRNYVWVEPTSGDNLTFNWKASNSMTNILWRMGWHIDTRVRITRGSGSNFNASLTTDHFPTYEVYQYPRWSTNGFPVARTLVTCGQHQITGLTDSPSERRNC